MVKETLSVWCEVYERKRRTQRVLCENENALFDRYLGPQKVILVCNNLNRLMVVLPTIQARRGVLDLPAIGNPASGET